MTRFMVFGWETAVGLDQLLKRIPAGVDPQDVTLTLVLRGVETNVEVEFDEGEAAQL